MSEARQGSAPEILSGSPGKILSANGWDLRALRPVLRGNGQAIRANDLLRKDEWKALDDAVVPAARRQLGAIEDMRAAGLTRNLGSLGVLLDEYEAVSDIDPAEQSMSGVAPGQRDLATFTLNSVPIPITFRDFQIHLRHLEASRRGGSGIDTTNAELCAQRVAEKLEAMLFNGSTVAIGGNAVAGLTTASSRITGSLTGDWATFPTVTGDNIITDVLAMIAAAEDENYFGQFMFYVPVSYMQVLRNDFKANSDKTIMDRMMEIDAVQGVRGTTSLTSEVIAVRLTRDVLDLSIASDVTTVQWDEMGGMIQNFKVMAAMAPRVKIPATANAKTGLVHYT
jgi:uncharacterized linocin/CFP29 family protein